MLEPFLRLLLAAALSGVIGLDRELRAKPAGLRTNILVGVAAAAFAYASSTAFNTGDPGRIAAQIVSGIGFLGGGAIFAAGGRPHGLTTAAALWASSAAGLAAGVGSYATGVALVVVAAVALGPTDYLASTLLGTRRRSDLRLTLVVRDLEAANRVRQRLREICVRVDHVDVRPFGDRRITLEASLHGTRALLTEALQNLRSRGDVLFMSEESARETADDDRLARIVAWSSRSPVAASESGRRESGRDVRARHRARPVRRRAAVTSTRGSKEEVNGGP